MTTVVLPERAADGAAEGREYRWALLAAVILSLATLASAWCGFQAATWNSVFATDSRTANTARLEAARQAGIADRQMSNDVLIFTTWVEAELKGDDELANAIEMRFREYFRPAFDIWRAQPVGADGHLPDGTPLDLPEYVLPTQADADAATARAEAALASADEAGIFSSRYVLTTVLFASVLFLSGIASKLAHQRLVHAVVVLASLALAGAMILLVTLPVHLGSP